MAKKKIKSIWNCNKCGNPEKMLCNGKCVFCHKGNSKDNDEQSSQKDKIVLIPCEFCKKDFGVPKEKYQINKPFIVRCPYCHKDNNKNSQGRFLDLARSL